MNEQACFERALELAASKHKGQTDKGGNPYILHPLAVMSRMDTLEEKTVALLHDIVEDTDVTFETLEEEEFPEDIIDGVRSVTREENETYDEFIKRCKENALGRKVKRGDLLENSDLSRIPNPTKRDIERVNTRYKKALEYLE
ncbi:HD domain-containing protein (plasmid) [Pontibacillus sp. ALD_SL1]|uniref:HD domain-containing protein n=1 Tax=Pontibacillus sp. ALD_SL1 TaxID=2777185 RepID=UPI001A974255|nr:HD domain-containing protein [Pontibacillus sp. ALD_SL1]QST02276.1 HD domain-containing protein [Pontibacillus sp. ALD_SL1]